MKKTTIFIFLASATLFVTFNWLWMALFVKKKQLQELTSQATNMCDTSTNSPLCKNLLTVTKAMQNVNNINKVQQKYSNMPWNLSLLEQAKLYGKTQSNKRFLTIGIPTVSRKKENYLEKTLHSLFNGSDSFELSEVTILVLFADSDLEVRLSRANAIAKIFNSQIDSGVLRLIQILPDVYPEISVIRRTFNDSAERVKWRAKQVLDFAFLFFYGASLSENFLILEDDVIASKHYISAIQDFVKVQQQDWVSLTFSGFLIIGRLVKSKDLDRLVKFLLLFHLEKPVDLLILQYLDLLVPSNKFVTRRIPGIFQHIGLHSSLSGKVQKAKDKSFISSTRKFDSRNPEADIITSLGIYKNHYPELCFSTAYGFFWGMSPSKGDTFDIIFPQPIAVKRIFIDSGLKSHPNDKVKYAEVKVSFQFVKMLSNKKAQCLQFETVGTFIDGKADILSNQTAELINVQCIRIEFVKKQSNWVIINEIAILT